MIRDLLAIVSIGAGCHGRWLCIARVLLLGNGPDTGGPKLSPVHPPLAVLPHVPEAGYDIRTVQELLGHNSVETTMIYMHVLNRGGRGLRSPADRL